MLIFDIGSRDCKIRIIHTNNATPYQVKNPSTLQNFPDPDKLPFESIPHAVINEMFSARWIPCGRLSHS